MLVLMPAHCKDECICLPLLPQSVLFISMGEAMQVKLDKDLHMGLIQILVLNGVKRIAIQTKVRYSEHIGVIGAGPQLVRSKAHEYKNQIFPFFGSKSKRQKNWNHSLMYVSKIEKKGLVVVLLKYKVYKVTKKCFHVFKLFIG